MGGGEGKRKKSQSSPQLAENTPGNRVSGRAPKMANQTLSPSQTQSFLQQPYPGVYPPQYGSPQFMPNVLQTPTQLHNPFQTTVLEQLTAMESRLKKLDTIEEQISSVSKQLTKMNTRVSSLETKLEDTNRKLSDIEQSRSVDAQICQEINTKQTEIDKHLKDEASRISQMSRDLDQLKRVNTNLSEDIIDLQSRSMRDNLMFFGFPEPQNPDDRKKEDCSAKICNFCVEQLHIPDAATTIKLDRAHRVGRYVQGKTRPIVAKFNFHQDKLNVKRKAFEHLDRQSNFRVADQFPKQIQERRKRLIPAMIHAKQRGKNAVLSYDKLFINGQQFTADNISAYDTN